MARKFWFVLFFQFTFLLSKSQMEGRPPISIADFDRSRVETLDSTAHAIVISEIGRSRLRVNEQKRAIQVVHQYAVRILILDSEGFDQANQVIPLFKFGSDFESIDQIRGATYHITNQSIVATEMSKNAIFHEKINDFAQATKFTLPNISENCILDIEYEIVSPNIFNYRSWHFQEDIPKLYSEYTAIIPGIYEYNVTLQGPYTLTDQKSKILKDDFLINGKRFDSSQLTYSMENIPAFKEESYMLAPINYKSAINFELKRYYTTNGITTDVTKEWRDVDRELLKDKEFGGQLERKNNFKHLASSNIYSKIDSEEEKAKKIYRYIQKNITWNQFYGKFSQLGVKDALEKRTGNVADINLALISALNTVGIESYPVLVSTRENGLPNSLHPVMSDFNYVIASANVGGKTYLLDASDENLPFGLLPLRCINGNGRIIYSKKSSEWIKLENKEEAQTHTTLTGILDESGQFTGQLTIIRKGLDGLQARNYMSRFSSMEDYIEDRASHTNTMDILDGTVYHQNNTDEDLMEEFKIKIDFSTFIHNGNLIINPILFNRITKNPFNLEERTYEVDLGSKMQETYNLSIRLPEGYQVIHQPKNTKLVLPDDAAQYTYLSVFEYNTLNLRQGLSLNKAIYDVDEYFHLKEFYSRIIQQQKIDFSFSKSL